MKNSIFKNFLNGASVVVISLLATINPSSAKDTGALLQRKPLLAKRSGISANVKPSLVKKSGISANVKPSLVKRSGISANVKSPLAKRSGISANVKPSLVKKSGISKKSAVSVNVKSPLAKRPGISANVKPALPTRSLTSTPKMASLSQQPSLTDLLLSGRQKTTAARNKAALRQQGVATPKMASVSQQLSLTDLLFSEKQKATVARNKAALHQQEVARQQVIEQQRQQEVARQRVVQQRQQEVARQRVIEQQRQQELARQREELRRREEEWNRFTPAERLVRTQFVKTTTPLTQDELRWILVGREGHLLAMIQEPLNALPQQNGRVQDLVRLVDGLVFATSVQPALAGRNQAGERLENFDVPARIQAYRNNIDEIEETIQVLVGLGVHLPPQLVGVRDQLVRQVPIVREALNAPNSVELFRGVAQLRGNVRVTRTLEDVENALEELNQQSLGLLMTPQVLTPLREALVNNVRVGGALNALADVHRITQLFNIRAIDERMQAFRTRPIQDALQNLHIEPHNGRVIQRDWQEVFSPAVDLGYQGSGRTLQYGNIGQGLNLPKAPVFHPYNPTDSLLDGWGAPAFTLNLKLPPGYNAPDFAPATLNAHLRGRDPNTIDYYVVVQDVPWNLALAPLQYRPQSYLDPECPFSSDLPVAKNLPARIGVFSRNPGGPLIQGQGDGALLEANGTITVHNSRQPVPHVDVNDAGNILLRQRAQRNEQLTVPQNTTVNNVLMNLARAHQNLTPAEAQRVTALGWKPEHPDLFGDEKFISSGAAHPLLNFNMNDSRVIWSLTERLDGNRRLAVTKHILLTPAHNAVLEEVLKRPNVHTYRHIQRELQQPDTRNRLGFGGGNLADEFDIPVR